MTMTHQNDWFVWFDTARSPFLNMAIDEILLDIVQLTNKPVLRFYEWNTPSISIGYSQTLPQSDTIYSIVRRPTGGGIVYHDSDITYSSAIPYSHPICRMSRNDSYKYFHLAIVDFFLSQGINSSLSPENSFCEDRKTMRCFLSPSKYDVIYQNEKLAGAAQRRGRKGILHQGSIVIPSKITKEKKELTHAIVNSFIKIHSLCFSEFNVDKFVLDEACRLVQNKYSNDSWNKSSKC